MRIRHEHFVHWRMMIGSRCQGRDWMNRQCRRTSVFLMVLGLMRHVHDGVLNHQQHLHCVSYIEEVQLNMSSSGESLISRSLDINPAREQLLVLLLSLLLLCELLLSERRLLASIDEPSMSSSPLCVFLERRHSLHDVPFVDSLLECACLDSLLWMSLGVDCVSLSHVEI